MRKRLSRRLAGCIAIELLAGFLFAADFEYKAGLGTFANVHVLAIEDHSEHRAVLVWVGRAMTAGSAGMATAQAAKQYDLDPAGVLVLPAAEGDSTPEDVVTAVGSALQQLQPVQLRWGAGALTISASGKCRAAVSVGAVLSENGCNAKGSEIHGPLRFASQQIDLKRLGTREEPLRASALQAIAIGNAVTVIAAPKNYIPAGSDVIAAAGEPVTDDRIAAALRLILLRVGRKPR
jgi:hypothetical protein